MFIPICSVFAQNDISVFINGNKLSFDVSPVIQNGRTLVPMRALFEALGANVHWHEESQHAQGVAPGVVVDINIGEQTMHRNTVEVNLDVPAQIINDRTMIPLRVVSECFGMNVDWDGDNNNIYLTSNDNIKRLDWNDNYYYIGEAENGIPTGYGALYNYETDMFDLIGLFDSENILKGTIIYEDNLTYTGSFVDGFPNGNGTIYYPNGEIYVGDVKNLKRDGKGIYYFADNSYMDGEWKNDDENGSMIFYYAYFNVTYIGNYENGKREGVFLVKDHESGISNYAEYKDDQYTGRSWPVE